VLQRHVEEQPLERRQRRIRRQLHSRESERERLPIRGEGAMRAAEGMAGELIEQQDEREAPPRARFPGRKLAL
jgi:hypothetical protein